KRAQEPDLDRRVLVQEREDDEEERQKEGRSLDRARPGGRPRLPDRTRTLLALVRFRPVCALPARALGRRLLCSRRRLDFLSCVVDVDVFVLVPALFLAAASLLA